MPTKPKTFKPHRAQIKAKRKPDDRPTAHQRGYTGEWQRYRAVFLSDPANVICAVDGCRKLATQVDHIIPHRGDHEIFWREGNLQALCAFHHGQKTAREKMSRRRGE